jgi:hypothetical protein
MCGLPGLACSSPPLPPSPPPPPPSQPQVEYDDGDRELLHLAVEHVRLQVVPGEVLQPRLPQELEATAGLLHGAAEQLQLSPHQRGKAGPRPMVCGHEGDGDSGDEDEEGQTASEQLQKGGWPNGSAA